MLALNAIALISFLTQLDDVLGHPPNRHIFGKMSVSNTLPVLALLSMMTMLASGKVVYDYYTQVCCNGTVGDGSGRDGMGCCGPKPINRTTTLCSPHYQLLHLPDTVGYASCYDPTTKTSMPFHHHTQLCCDGKTFDKPDPNIFYYDCCNGQLFETITKMCCGGVIRDISDDDVCCGQQEMYNKKSQLCCEQYGYLDSITYGVLGFAVNDADRDTSACCGLKSYDLTTETCCNGVVKPKTSDIGQVTFGQCCGSEPYDPSTQFCCSKNGNTESQLYDTDEESAYRACCGLSMYDYREEVCCSDEKLIAKPEDCDKEQFMSCCDLKVITNHTTQLCYNHVLYQRDDDNFYVCGEELFDMRVQYCCGSHRLDYVSNLECCKHARKPFDPKTHMCCYDEIKRIPDEALENCIKPRCCAADYGSTISSIA